MAEKRSIFEEVGAETRSPAVPKGGMIDSARKGSRGAVRLWLMALFSLVVLMIAVGGLTRLTDSGLSITEWQPVAGALPPISDADWQTEFQKYQAIPEFRLQNSKMTLDQFKGIFWWEWGHRQLGRLIGLVWAVGFIVLMATRRIPPGWTGRLILPGLLGGLQGAIGWWMVSSGLTGRMVDVASYRLAIHLGLAFTILGVIAWLVLLLGRSEAALMQARRGSEAGTVRLGTVLVAALVVQILLGALVAGIDAGRSYNTWPLMDGQVLPPHAFDLTPLWSNFFENAGLVQWMHRTVGYFLVLVGIFAWMRSRRSGNGSVRFAFDAVLAMLVLQLLLGIATVLYAAPLGISILHQFGAVLLWSLILRARFMARYPAVQSVRGGK